MNRKGAVPLASTLASFLESLRIPHVAFLITLRKEWPEIAGPLVARNAVPLSLKNGVLTIAVRNHSWAQELRMNQSTVLSRIRESVGERVPVTDLRFTVDPLAAPGPEGPAPPEAPRFPPGPEPDGLSSVADAETRESLRAIGRLSRPGRETPPRK